MDAEPEHGGGEGRDDQEVVAHLGQREVDPEEDHQHRHPAEEADVETGERAHRRQAREPQQRYDQADRAGEAERDQHQLERAERGDAHLDEPIAEMALVAAQELDHAPPLSASAAGHCSKRRRLRERQGQPQIEQRADQVDLAADAVHEGRLDQAARLEHDLRRGDRRDDRGILDQRDRVVAERRQHDPDRLWQDDEAHRLERRHAERERGLHLTAMDRLDAGAVDLAEVGRAVDAEADDRGADRVELDAEVREAEVDDEELDQRRRAAQDVGVDQRHGADRPQRRDPHQRDHEPEQEGHDQSAERDPDGHRRRQPEDRQELRQPVPRAWSRTRSSPAASARGSGAGRRGCARARVP